MRNPTSKAFAAIVVILALLLTLVGCDSDKPSTSPSQEKLSLRLQWLPQTQFAGFYVAKAKGFYKDVGLDVTINPGGQDFNAATLVSTGSDDIGIWTADQVLLAFSRGMPLRAIGVVFDRSLAAFMVHKDSDILTPRDFEGRTVGIYYGYDTETLYLHLLKKFAVDRSTINETALQYDLARFFNRTVDVWPAYAINQPIAAKQNNVPVRLLTPDEFGIRYYSDTLIVHKDTLAERPEVVRKFLEASAKGWAYAFDHRSEAVDIVMAAAPHLDRDHQQMMLDVVFSYFNKEHLFKMDHDTWASIQTILTEQELLKAPQDLRKLIIYELPDNS